MLEDLSIPNEKTPEPFDMMQDLVLSLEDGHGNRLMSMIVDTKDGNAQVIEVPSMQPGRTMRIIVDQTSFEVL